MSKKVHPQMLKIQKKQLQLKQQSKFEFLQFEQKAVLLCQFCGGQSCPQQDFRKNTVQPNAIQGLHSNWITNDILAMQRPSDRLINQYNLYGKFKKQNINTILNLQEAGQHPFCGDGLLSKIGFSYDPAGFFQHGIRFFNQSWEDMTATTFEHMMRIMNIFYVSIIQNKGKISVHCHAGRGRTLLVICSWLIYNDRFSAKYTIDLAVQRRQGVLTRSSQREFLYEFEQQLKQRWKTFGQIKYQTFSEYVQKQNASFLKAQQKFTANKPYIHSCILSQLRKRLKNNPSEVINCLIQNYDWSLSKQQQLAQLKTKMNEHRLFVYNRQKAASFQTMLLIQLLYDFYECIPYRIIGPVAFQLLMSSLNGQYKNNLLCLVKPQIVHEIGIQGLEVMLDLTHLLAQIVKEHLNIKQQQKQQSEGYQQYQCLFLRISTVLSSKRKYHPNIFKTDKNVRCSKLFKYPSKKRQIYLGQDIVKLSNFLSILAKDMPEQLSGLQPCIRKIQKIDTNLHYYIQKQGKGEQMFSQAQIKQIYDKSKI